MYWLQLTAGGICISLGLAAILFGVYAVLHLKSFYARIVITSKVEAMGFTAITLGCMILAGATLWTAKLAFILVFELLTVAVSSHAIARSAWKSGYHLHLKEEALRDD
ncbi:MAG: cation:proton antiporter [Kiritimatiellia bacterium]